MSTMDEFQALATSIGEHCVHAVETEHLLALEVLFEPEERACRVSVVLRENSDAEQRRALNALFEVEDLFLDDAAFSFHFVDSIEHDTKKRAAVPQFSFA